MSVTIEHKTASDTGDYVEFWAQHTRLSGILYASHPNDLYVFTYNHDAHMPPARLAAELRELADVLDSLDPGC